MRRNLQTKRGRKRYALRMATVEPVFGQIKQGRGFREFLLRGLEKVQGEWSLICTGHNLLKLFRHCCPLANPTPPSPLTVSRVNYICRLASISFAGSPPWPGRVAGQRWSGSWGRQTRG